MTGGVGELRVCERCGGEYTSRVHNNRYCCRDCKRLAFNARVRAKTGDAWRHRKCRRCGKQFTTDHPQRFYCSDVCAQAVKHEWFVKNRYADQAWRDRVCGVCGKPYTAGNPHQHYCCADCATVAKKRRNDARPRKVYAPSRCAHCGGEYTPHNGSQKFCCRECFDAHRVQYEKANAHKHAEANRRRVRERYRDNPEYRARVSEYNRAWAVANREKSREIKKRYADTYKGRISHDRYLHGDAYRKARQRKDAKRRMRKFGVHSERPIDRDIHWSTLAERTGSMKCVMCGILCVPNSADPNIRPTVDHIIPIFEGGSHTWDNVQLLCMRCNAGKGCRMPDAETLIKIKHSNPTLHAMVLQRMDELRQQAATQGVASLEMSQAQTGG